MVQTRFSSVPRVEQRFSASLKGPFLIAASAALGRTATLKAIAAILALVIGLLAASASGLQHPVQSPLPARKAASSSPVSLADVTRASGIDFHLTCGGPEKLYIMESMCGGVAVLDYDNDGWMDIFLVNGSTLEDVRSGKCHPGKLYHNNHDGTFTDPASRPESRIAAGASASPSATTTTTGGKTCTSVISMAGCFTTTITTDRSAMSPAKRA